MAAPKSPQPDIDLALPNGSKLEKLIALIVHAEERSERYDTVNGQAKIRPPKRPTQMSIGEIVRWIEATSGQQHAIGGFQFIPSTLASLAQRHLTHPDTIFDVRTQKLFARSLISDAEYADFLKGDISLDDFMDNLSVIWAGFPNRSGVSTYDGYAKNKATITRKYFSRVMNEIFF